jgi:hypothetical protein
MACAGRARVAVISSTVVAARSLARQGARRKLSPEIKERLKSTYTFAGAAAVSISLLSLHMGIAYEQ